jgi:hypothetical protein
MDKIIISCLGKWVSICLNPCNLSFQDATQTSLKTAKMDIFLTQWKDYKKVHRYILVIKEKESKSCIMISEKKQNDHLYYLRTLVELIRNLLESI